MKIRCADCGADVQVPLAEPFIRCPYCDSTLYLDSSHTFKNFLLKPKISATMARDLLIEDWRKKELKPLPILEVHGKLLPFWRVEDGELGETIPAFPPPHGSLAEYKIMRAEADFFTEVPEGFDKIECSEASSACWQGEVDRKAFSMYHVPFYEIVAGSEKSQYAIWVGAVNGRVYFDEAPPSVGSNISTRFWSVLLILFVIFAAEGLVLPFFLALPAVILTAGLFFPFLGNFLEGGGET